MLAHEEFGISREAAARASPIADSSGRSLGLVHAPGLGIYLGQIGSGLTSATAVVRELRSTSRAGSSPTYGYYQIIVGCMGT